MTLCVVTKHQCVCQPDEGAFCPDYKPDAYVQCLMDAIRELRTQPPEEGANVATCAYCGEKRVLPQQGSEPK